MADVVLGAEDYDSEVRFSGERAVFMGVWVLPNANSLDVIKAVRRRDGLDPEEFADRPHRARGLRRDGTTFQTRCTR